MNNENTNREERIVPSGIYPFPDTGHYEMKRGERHNLVLILQIMLDMLKMYYDTFGSVYISGYYDLATERAVREFQRINGLEESGKVGVVTWNRLAEEFNASIYENQ